GAMLFALGTSPAHATIIDGINLPVGGTLVANVIAETLINGTGQKLSGLGFVSSITDTSLNQTYFYGQGGKYLTIAFNGGLPNAFTSSYILPPSPTTSGYIEFTGGNANLYVENSAPCLSSGSQATDIANAS